MEKEKYEKLLLLRKQFIYTGGYYEAYSFKRREF